MDKRMEKFLTLADTKSFSAAAKRLRVTQPAITLAIASLEHSLNCKLVIRQGTQLILTHEGELVAETARALQKHLLELQAKLHHTNSLARRIGTIDTIARLLLPDDTSSIEPKGQIRIDNSSRIIDWVTHGTVDAGIITAQPRPLGRRFRTIVLNSEPFHLVHAKPERVQHELSNWLACNADSTSFVIFAKALRGLGIEATPILYCTSMELLLDLARADKGAALLPRHMTRDAITTNELYDIGGFTIERPLWLIARRGDEPNYITSLASEINAQLSSSTSA